MFYQVGLRVSPLTSDFPVPVEPNMTTSGSVGGLLVAMAVEELTLLRYMANGVLERRDNLMTMSHSQM